MPSTAISAQGSTFQIGGTSGSAKTITGITVGFPTIITSTAHGFANGDLVAVAGVTGADAALLNGLTWTVSNITANTFAVQLNSIGKTLTGTGTATPTLWLTVGNVKTFSGFDGQASELDITNLASVAKEFKLGIVDYGQIQIEMDQLNADAGQAAMLVAYAASSGSSFKLTLPNANTATFTAYVKQFSSNGGVDQIVKRQATLRISGAVTWA